MCGFPGHICQADLGPADGCLALMGKAWDSIRPASKSRAEGDRAACLWQPASLAQKSEWNSELLVAPGGDARKGPCLGATCRDELVWALG